MGILLVACESCMCRLQEQHLSWGPGESSMCESEHSNYLVKTWLCAWANYSLENMAFPCMCHFVCVCVCVCVYVFAYAWKGVCMCVSCVCVCLCVVGVWS